MKSFTGRAVSPYKLDPSVHTNNQYRGTLDDFISLCRVISLCGEDNV